MNYSDLDACLDAYLEITKEMDFLVDQEEFSEDELLVLLEKRELMIHNIQQLLNSNQKFSDKAKQMTIPLIETLHHKILPILESRKENVGQTVNSMKRAQNMQKNYQDFEYYEFGAYIDKKN